MLTGPGPKSTDPIHEPHANMVYSINNAVIRVLPAECCHQVVVVVVVAVVAAAVKLCVVAAAENSAVC